MRVRRRPVRAVLLRLLALLCTALLVSGATATVGILTIRHEVLLTRTTITPLVDAGHELRSSLLRAQGAARGTVLTADPSFAEEYRRSSAEVRQARDELTAVAGERLDAGDVVRLDEEIESWLAATSAVSGTGRRDEPDLVAAARHMDTTLTVLGDLERQIGGLREDSRARIQRTISTSLTAVLVVVAASVAASLWGLRRVDRLLALPLVRLQQIVARLRAGDSSARATTSHGAAEVVEVARAVNAFADDARSRLITVAQSLQAHSAEARELAEQRRLALDTLQELDRQKSQFLSTTSHELRTPLTSITGYLEMLEDGDFGELGADQRRALGIVHRNARRLQLLIEDVLLLNRMDSGPPPERLETLDLAGCVENVLVNLAPQAARAGVSLGTAPPGTWPVVGDRDRLERAVTNVVGNAVKFTPAGGRVDLALETGGDGSSVLLHCTDTGMGIPAEDLEKLFTSFVRASNATTRQVPGTGLGLVIVRAIAEQHGGTVRLDSVEGQGTHVVLELPLAQQKP